MATAISVNISMSKSDVPFVRQLAKRMGWSVVEEKAIKTDHLYDPETGAYLNDETMQAIRDVEAGKVTRCKDIHELLAQI